MKSASLTRLLYIATAYRVFSFLATLLLDGLFEDFDHSTFLLLDYENLGYWQKGVFDLFKGQLRWDSLFYIEIAEKGYLNEKNHAFFPLFPLLLNLLSRPLDYLVG